MASKSSLVAFLLSLALVLILGAPSANSALLNGITNIDGIILNGGLRCTPTGNPIGPGLANVAVNLTYNGVKLAEGITNNMGNYVLTLIDSLPNALSNLQIQPISGLNVVVGLPIATCSVTPPSGILRGAVTILTNTTQQIGGSVFGLAQALPWQLVFGN